MMDELFEDSPGNTPEFTVSDITGAVKRLIEGEFGHVRVRGEVGRVVTARTGHMYFDLKDDRSVIACVSWKGQASRFRHRPEEGMEVIATGRMTTFGPQSKYQLNVEDVEPAGAGALMAMLEARKKKLAAEGLFEASRKRPLPFLPEVIGVVTSPSGAVIRDILHRLRDRFPRKVLIWPVAVQGRNCAPEVVRAIEGFNRLTPGGAMPRPDLLIVARGGGSIEDLWGFNEEEVARAAAASAIPLISAVGHETDTTLIDFVSDHRAPTPTAAAERAVPVRAELLAWTDTMNARLIRAGQQGLDQRGQRLRDLARALPRREALLEGPRQRFDYWAERLPMALRAGVQARRLSLHQAAGGLRPRALEARVEAARDRLSARSERLDPGLVRAVATRREALDRLAARLRPEALTRETSLCRERVDALAARLAAAGEARNRRLRDRLEGLERLRLTLGYEATLERGYAVVRDAEGRVVTGLDRAAAQARLEVQFGDGRLAVAPLDGPDDGGAANTTASGGGKGTAGRARPAASRDSAPKRAEKAGKTDAPDQGSLF